MALSTNSIDIFSFISLTGEWQPPAQQLELDQRPGVNGTTITKLGRRGIQFRMRSFVDTATFSDAVEKIGRYQTLINSDPVNMTYAGVNSVDVAPIAFQVQVLDVRKLWCGPIVGAFGNALNPPSAAAIEAEWTLIAIEYVF